jgi:membrane protease YdiL (CAAX protease family)
MQYWYLLLVRSIAMSTKVNDNQPDIIPSRAGWQKWILGNPLIDLLRLALAPGTVAANSATVGWIRQYPKIALVGLAYVLTWIGLIPVIRDPTVAAQANWSHASNPAVLIYAFLGVLGCIWAALIVAGAVGGAAGRYTLLRGYLNWRVDFQWYLVVLFFPAILFAIAIGLDFMLTGKMPAVPAFDLLPTVLISSYGFFIIRYMIGNFEEICWRASLLPRLQTKNSALIASLIVGVIQGFWHLPFAFINGHYVQMIGLPAMVIQSVAMGIVFTWVYNNTRGSLLLVALFHAAYDALSQFEGIDVKLFYLNIGVWCVTAIILTTVFGARHLSHKPESELAYTIIPTEA